MNEYPVCSFSDGNDVVARSINQISADIHQFNRRWWTDPETGLPIQRNVGEMLMLAVSELAEAMEGHRKNLMDDHLPHRTMIEVEIADCMIRLLDMARGLKLNVGSALVEKCLYNQTRADHTLQARMQPNGKKY